MGMQFELEKRKSNQKNWRNHSFYSDFVGVMNALREEQQFMGKDDLFRVIHHESSGKKKTLKKIKWDSPEVSIPNLPVPSTEEGFEAAINKIAEEIADETDFESEDSNEESFDIYSLGINEVARIGGKKLSNLPHENAWEELENALTFPVGIVTAYFNMGSGDLRIAEKVTPEGRESQYYFVVVDPERSGNFNPVYASTDRYSPPNLADYVHRIRQAESGDISIHPDYITLTCDGSQITTHFSVQGLEIPDVGAKKAHFGFIFRTSVNGSLAHSFYPIFELDDVMIPLGEASGIKTKNTKNINKRLDEFHEKVDDLIENWNENLIPMVQLFGEKKAENLDEIVEGILDSLKLSNRKRGKIGESVYGESVLDVIQSISRKLRDEAKSEQDYYRNIQNFPKALSKLYNKLAE